MTTRALVLRLRFVCIALVVTAAASAEDDRPLRWVKDKTFQKRIHVAIDRGIEFLLSIQKEAGYWPYHDAGLARDAGRFGDPARRRAAVQAERVGGHDGGLTAVVLYALGASGIQHDHPQVDKALEWLETHPQFFDERSIVGVYASSFLVLALTRLDAQGFATRIRRLADHIAASQLRSGMWAYRLSKRWEFGQPIQPLGHGRGDGSNTQIAVVALWAAHSLAGWVAPVGLWERVERHYRKGQMRVGTWSYRPGAATRLDTMTAAGVACYVYARAALDGSESALQGARASKTAQRGLEAHQGLMAKPNWHDYYLVYAIERVGTVLGLDDLGWYERGARVLIRRQDRKRGYWQGRSLGRDTGNAYETALAILFLSRASFPPVKGATTPPDRSAPATTTPGGKAPVLAQAKSHARAFEIYLSSEPDVRKAQLRTMGARGPGLIDQLIGVLARDRRTSARVAALELLQRLLDKRLLYVSNAPASERLIMAAGIQATWQRMRDGVTWDRKTGRYVAN